MALSWDLTSYFFTDDFRIATTVGSAAVYAIKFDKQTAEVKYGMIGSDPDVAFFLLYKLADFSSVPDEGDKITIGSTAYRIKSVERDSRNICIKYGMMSEFD